MVPGNGASENTVPGEGAVEVFLKVSFAHRNFSAECYNLKWLGHLPREHWYIRVLMNCVAFACCFSDKKLFAVLYFVSFVCDGLDGWFARKFNQVSTFGAVLDMVTDRVSTACLLVILSHFYRPAVVFLSLLSLDIASHWLQMYSMGFISSPLSSTSAAPGASFNILLLGSGAADSNPFPQELIPGFGKWLGQDVSILIFCVAIDQLDFSFSLYLS
ncbi:hypothetical protein MRB53_032049 [Persea americana]|uniref:Uncharacterized protein n=1 Tax=Persea americana TaxID=3435 RepID=A0ACC2KQT5_PERAE|nr:hypothetical protein MRB53_032049 [Persea americana]